MIRLAVPRLIHLVPVLFGVSLVVFLVIRLLPGDVGRLIGGPEATEAQIAQIRLQLGLDKPLWEQYAIYLQGLLRADLGQSVYSRSPVIDEIGQRYPNTILLALLAMLIGALLGTSLGAIAALRQHTWLDGAASVSAVVGLSMPSFWFALLIMGVFAERLRWLPSVGAGGPQHLVLPAITLGVPAAAIIARMTRAMLLEVLAEDYVRTARAKGLAERPVILGHALRSALIPIVTVIGLQAGFFLGGAVVVEAVFAYPGIGKLLVDAIASRDYPVVQGVVLIVAVTFVLVNLVVDLSYVYLDPRIRRQ